MNSFGGTPLCATCSKPVYAAEQVIGPARKVYHKPCLKCTACNKRLDSHSLVEHNDEPYCRPCHIRHFSIRDLRHQNLSPAPRPVPTSPNPNVISEEMEVELELSHPSSSRSPSPTPRSPPPVVNSFRPLSPSLTGASSQPFVPRTPPSAYNRPLRPTWTGEASRTTPFSGASPNRSVDGINLNPLSPMSTGRSVGSPRFGGERVECPKCKKAVYHAEQVIAVGKKWHKHCLRCTECSSLLDSTRLTDKEGEPFCRACYAKLHGPQGGGYALLGRAG
ncbi:hypothetical protein BOTBODRAFT_135940 [Botryobasidium botryosum FD-172 SS1]|uniref:LIM zinc-binding domain-containing protein n=1 Tax=Botryobasidium botryosum (strain FD-172 SS1) TaxID=930990 RepID=A0A067M921_BOTB1|nr:hypothetical protein BOTBODRAFT_135940 [Botryobasidium botryosum FD-172 SS1]